MFPRLPDGRLGPKEIIARMKGGDNIMKYGDYFLTTAHYDDVAFMKHKNNPEKSLTIHCLSHSAGALQFERINTPDTIDYAGGMH